MLSGQPSRQRYRLDGGDPFFVVGVPLEGTDAVYFEATPLGDLEDTLRSLGLTLLAASAVTTLAGIAIGAWASRRVLSPLQDVSDNCASHRGR